MITCSTVPLDLENSIADQAPRSYGAPDETDDRVPRFDMSAGDLRSPRRTCPDQGRPPVGVQFARLVRAVSSPKDAR